MTLIKMNKGYLYRKQSCGFSANLEMFIVAEVSKEFSVEFKIDLDVSSNQTIYKGIKLVLDRSDLSPHKFVVTELIEHQKNTPPFGFEMCAQGATRLALGISKLNASYPYGYSIPEKALEELSFHSSRNDNIKEPRWENGFLGSLRPFQSMELVEQNFHKVIRNLRDLLKHISDNDCLCKNLVNDVSGIICFGRAWAVEEDGMLRRNNLITKEQTKLIEDWIDCISYALTVMLDTGDEETAFELYDTHYKK
jgi:hypothetical protein